MSDYMLQLLGRPITIDRVFLGITGGNYTAAALLSRLWDWHIGSPHGIIYRTRKEIMEETGLRETQYDAAITTLVRLELISTGATDVRGRGIVVERRNIRLRILDYLNGVMDEKAAEIAAKEAAGELFGKPEPPVEPQPQLFPAPPPVETEHPSVDTGETALPPTTPLLAGKAEYSTAIDTIIKAYDAAYRRYVSDVPIRHGKNVFIILARKLREKIAGGVRVYPPEQLGEALASAFTSPDPWIRNAAPNTGRLLSDAVFPQLWAEYLQTHRAQTEFKDGKVEL